MALSTRLGLLILLLSTAAAVAAEKEPLTLAKAKELRASAVASQMRRAAHHNFPKAPAEVASGLARAEAGSGSPLVFPRTFGADPTGKKDASDAFDQAIAALLSAASERDGGRMASGITSLGGVTLDLEGGLYNLSRPLVIPAMVANLHIVRGTLRASPSFPSDGFLIHIGNDTCHPDNQGSCNEFVSVTDVLLDGAHVAAGGVYVSHVMGTTLGPAIFITGFTQYGIHIVAGHEVMVTNAWICEYYWSDARPQGSTSVGIQIDGNDHILNDVIVFDYTHIGVVVNGAANLLIGVHTWNGGGTGIAVNAKQVRLLGCYLDYNTLNLTDPENIVVESTFFLQTLPFIIAGKAASIDNLAMRFNTYDPGHALQLVGEFKTCSNFRLDDGFQGARRTTARVSTPMTKQSQITVDLADKLLFGHIDWFQYTLVQPAGAAPVASSASPPNGTQLTINLAEATEASVHVLAMQCM